jgi:hypothetical protein
MKVAALIVAIALPFARQMQSIGSDFFQSVGKFLYWRTALVNIKISPTD